MSVNPIKGEISKTVNEFDVVIDSSEFIDAKYIQCTVKIYHYGELVKTVYGYCATEGVACGLARQYACSYVESQGGTCP
jgi:hypothetical protein